MQTVDRPVPAPRPPALRLVVLTALACSCLLAFVAPVAAQAGADADAIAAEVDATGSYVEPDLDADARTAIGEANERGVGVVLLSSDASAVDVARSVLAELEGRDSRYRTVLVVSRQGAAGGSTVFADRMQSLIDPGTPAFTAFAQGRTADGIRRFAEGLDADAEEPAGGTPSEASDDTSFPWVALLVVVALVGLGVGAFWLVRQRQDRRREEVALEARRAEVAQQLRNNADRVIDLGDAVIASGDAELIDLYDRASSTFREVSHSLDGVSSRDALGRLDERLDQAEWEFEVIEARLSGRTPPGRPPFDGSAQLPPGGPPPPPPSRPAAG